MKTHYEQAESSDFFQHLDICCQKIAQQVGEKQISDWTNGDYVKLSDLLAKKTKIQLSESTLKRIFGKARISDRYYPQKATRDALAQFVGYRDWAEFEFGNDNAANQHLTPPKTLENISDAKPGKNREAWLMLAAFVGLALILILIVLKPAAYSDMVRKVKLVCINPTGTSPHTAIFKLKTSEKNLDSMSRFSVDFNDERTKRDHFTDSILNHYYESPGRYYPRLYYNNLIIDTSYVYVQSNGWLATGINELDTTRVYPVVLPPMNRAITITPSEAVHAGIDTLHTFYLAFSNIKPTKISGDNYELSVQFNSTLNTEVIRCSQVSIDIFGEFDKYYIKFTKPDCNMWARYQFAEMVKDGRNDDLKFLGHDFSGGGRLKVHVKNKVVSLFIDNKQVYKTQHKNSIGRIMGVTITFAGIGSFEQFRLSDLITGERF